jgi:hypothetical protein
MTMGRPIADIDRDRNANREHARANPPAAPRRAPAEAVTEVWEAFLGAVADREFEFGLLDADLSVLVMYPCGSGGVVWDHPVGKPPPKRLRIEWTSTGEAIQLLGVRARPGKRSKAAATSPATGVPVRAAAKSPTSGLGELYVLRLQLCDELEAVKVRRATHVCKRIRKGKACWERSEEASPCDACTARQADHEQVGSLSRRIARLDGTAKARIKKRGAT